MKLKIQGIVRIDTLVAELSVWLDAQLFPFPTMKVKVFDRDTSFAAFANVNLRSGGEAGLGDTVEEAVNELLLRFVARVKERAKVAALNESDFEWSAPEDF